MHEPRQRLLFLINALQHSSGCEKFERAAHRESLLRPIIKTLVVTGIECGLRRFDHQFVPLPLEFGLPHHHLRPLRFPSGKLTTESALPSMVRRMPFFHGNKDATTRCTNFSTCAQCAFNVCAIIRHIDNLGGKKQRIIRRSWPEQFDCVLRRDSARRSVLIRAFHQMIGRRPVAMAIEQRPDDAAIQDSLKRFVSFLRFPFRDDFAVLWKTANV